MAKLAAILILLLSLHAHSKQLIVAVVDTGFDKELSNAPLCSDSNPLPDRNKSKHGTNVVDLISQNAGQSDYCIYPFSVYVPEFNMEAYLSVLTLLTHMHIDVLNLSMQGSEYSFEEAKLLKVLLDQGVTIFAAAGNRNQKITKTSCHVYPVCDDIRIVAIGTYSEYSATGNRINILTSRDTGCVGDYCLTGTSQATAIETGRFIHYLNVH